MFKPNTCNGFIYLQLVLLLLLVKTPFETEMPGAQDLDSAFRHGPGSWSVALQTVPPILQAVHASYAEALRKQGPSYGPSHNPDPQTYFPSCQRNLLDIHPTAHGIFFHDQISTGNFGCSSNESGGALQLISTDQQQQRACLTAFELRDDCQCFLASGLWYQAPAVHALPPIPRLQCHDIVSWRPDWAPALPQLQEGKWFGSL